MRAENQYQSYSEAPRVFRPARVTGILPVLNFTEPIVETVSDHYIVRVGTYPTGISLLLGPIIVVPLGLKFCAGCQHFITFQHRAGISPIHRFRFSRDLCFGKQLPGPLHCGLPKRYLPKLRGLFCRVRPTIVRSLTLGFSPHLPVSVLRYRHLGSH